MFDRRGDTHLDVESLRRVEICGGDGAVERGSQWLIGVGGALAARLDQVGHLFLDIVERTVAKALAVGAVHDGLVVGGLRRDSLGRGQRSDRIVLDPVDPGRAELHGNAPGPIGVDAATEAISRLEHNDAASIGNEHLGGAQPRDPGADDQHVRVALIRRRCRGRGRR